MRKILVFVVLLVYTIMLMPIYTYDLGIGRADCTGPPVEIAFVSIFWNVLHNLFHYNIIKHLKIKS